VKQSTQDRPNRLRRHLAGAVTGGAAACVAFAAIVTSVQALPRGPELTAVTGTPASVVMGAYTGPAKRGHTAQQAWQRWSGMRSPYVLDFAAGDSWKNITGPSWLLRPWQASGRRLIYSMPMFPHVRGDTVRTDAVRLAQCAAGSYNKHWSKLARRLVERGMPTTIVRPGWEFDGSWYPWSARGRVADYARCFRQIVTTMRAKRGQRFQFLWNPGVGVHEFPAEQAYPGNQYVDYVGVDVYDTSWVPGTYPYPRNATAARRRTIAAAVWSRKFDGEHGLRFWVRFAAAHGKRLAIPEWGLSSRPDGRGGGDNPAFIANMTRFIRDPRNGVAFAMYFDADSAVGDRHRLSTSDSRFPVSRSLFRSLLEAQQ
jgi:hypothetical protein